MTSLARLCSRGAACPALSSSRRGVPGIARIPSPHQGLRPLRHVFTRGARAPTTRTVMASAGKPSVSTRIAETDVPCIVDMQRMMRGKEGVLSLAQGITHWQPPASALDAAVVAVKERATSSYGADDGAADLKAALQTKLAEENGLPNSEVMVTSGANQAFVNLVLTLTDAGDEVVFFRPYYFNHLMAVQMTGGKSAVTFGPCCEDTMHPDLDWLEGLLAGPGPPPKMVVVVNPCNPSGVLMGRRELERARDLCAAAGTWLVMDNTYEHFTYDGREHVCVSGPHVINVFSFSKAYGMMGWRVGYIAWDKEGAADLGSELLKAQDTIPICPCQISQRVALAALGEGRGWVQERVDGLAPNREAVMAALEPLGEGGVKGGEGAIYLWCKLPPGLEDDKRVVQWLVDNHGVCIIPGSACGVPGHVRVAYANLEPSMCREAAQRLRGGLEELVEKGAAAMEG